MRKNPTEAEKTVWEYIKGKQLGVKFRHQHIISQFIVDFACLSAMLIVEVDGVIHADQKDRDTARDQILSNLGFKVLRFSNQQVMTTIETVISSILDHLSLQKVPF